MLRRTLTMWWLHPAAKCQILGLSPARILFDLAGAYQVASKLLGHAAAPMYPHWLEQFDTPSAADLACAAQDIDQLASKPFFHLVVLLGGADAVALAPTLASVNRQFYRHLDFTQLRGDFDLNALNRRFASASPNDWVLLLQAGDVLAPQALYRYARACLAARGAAVLYADDDTLNAAGQRCGPRFKPDWSLTHLRETDFVGAAVALRAAALSRVGGLNAEDCRYGVYDVLLRVLDGLSLDDAAAVAHIPAVLLHRSMATPALPARELDAWHMAAVRAHLGRRSVAAKVSGTVPGCWRVHYQLPQVPPLVSIIVPTRDALALTRQCLQSLLSATTYARFEILLVDNQSADPAALAYQESLAAQGKVRLLHYGQPFNYSAMNNMAVRAASGEVVCLLNNDTQVITPDWLEEMVGQLLQPGVVVVGAKLLYPDGRVQHGGDLVGVGGVANHAHAWLERDDPGYCNRAVVAQELSAVTGACLLTWRSRYLELGGLDERKLAVTFNDVDYCLRVREAGGRVVWTPHALLYHHESVSRGKDRSPEKKKRAQREVAYMRKRWQHALQRDPFYNSNLSYERADFSLSNAPLVHKPWLR
jgi:GT2 family glycosyltransferase